MRTRAFRRHQVYRHLRRRLKEDRNQHHNDLACACWHDPRAMARFKEQPQICSCYGCGNQRKWEGPSMQERRANQVE
jgi:hypothetical protein